MDFLRPDKTGRSIQLNNLYWFYINHLSKIFIENELLYLNGALPLESWINYLQEDNPLPNPFKSLINKNDIVIGFEFSPDLIKWFEEENIKYVDVLFYPIRFTEKKILGIKSNFLQFDRISEEEFYRETKRFEPYRIIKEEYTLIIGQTEIDRSIYDGNKFLKFSDFEFNNHNCLFKPHPADPEFQIEYAKSKNWFILEGYDIYRLLKTENIKKVVGISSGVLREAKYFGKEVVTLREYEYPNNSTPVYEDDFWNNIYRKIYD
jgi:hypothetical protein